MRNLGKFTVGYSDASGWDHRINSLHSATRRFELNDKVMFLMAGAGINRKELIEAASMLSN